MKDRLRVKINHHLFSYNGIALFLGLMPILFLPVLAVFNIYKPVIFVLFIFQAIIPIPLSTFVSSINGWLTADNEKLHLRYVKFEKTVYLSDIKELSYGLYTEYAGRLSTKRMRLYITTLDGEVHTFSDRVDLEKLACALDAPMDTDIPIIKIYRFLEARLPDKAKGYVSKKDEFLFF
ncbi:MAG: hypothetical protein J6A37_16850 [Oscillospiraceae bacterium]|nr:hypothetical protein [Oscillospiraceae bacterium]